VHASAKLGNAKAKTQRPALAKIFAVSVREPGDGIDPNVKAFVDCVIVPALVEEYVAELRRENKIAANLPTVTQCSTSTTDTAEGKR
jgi:hypothetical protein